MNTQTTEQQIDETYEVEKKAKDAELLDAKAFLFQVLSKKLTLTENEVELHYHLKRDAQLAPYFVKKAA